MISYPAPALCQGVDEDALVQISSIIFPERIRRHDSESGLRIWVEGDPNDDQPATEALSMFQIALGILRAWKAEAGQLADELRRGLGKGSVRSDSGTQYIMVGSVINYNFPGEVVPLAASAKRGIQSSLPLKNALWLNGRQGRTAADYYMIHEYAIVEFSSPKGITAKLGLTGDSQSRLKKAANNLSPLDGGRHAVSKSLAPMTLEQQASYIAGLLRAWIRLY